jgi:hypothetical protein
VPAVREVVAARGVALLQLRRVGATSVIDWVPPLPELLVSTTCTGPNAVPCGTKKRTSLSSITVNVEDGNERWVGR